MAAIELRPLSIGELLDRTFSYYRKHFLLFVGIMALPQVLMVGVSVVIQALRLNAAFQPGRQDPAQVAAQLPRFMIAFFVSMGVMFVAMIVIYSIVHAATAFALSEVHLGRTTSIVNCFRALRGKIWRLFDVVISVLLRAFGVFFVFFLLMGVIIGLTASFGGLGKPDPVLILGFLGIVIIGMLVATVLGVFLIMRYALCVPALVLENVSARDAIRRSVALSKGNLGRIFLIMLLMYMINAVVASIFQGPFMVAMFLVGIKNGVMPLWLSLPMTISGGIGGALAGPLMVIGLTLLYFDARVRKEGFDLQFMMANLSQHGPSTAAGTVIAPAIPPAPSI